LSPGSSIRFPALRPSLLRLLSDRKILIRLLLPLISFVFFRIFASTANLALESQFDPEKRNRSVKE
jgi:hypothetical protein